MIDVIIVEDQTLYRDEIKRLINSADDMKCTGVFSNCQEALDFLNDGNIPDIILLDIKLPGLSGLEGISRFLEVDENLVILMLTIHDDSDKIYSALTRGAHGYILKNTEGKRIIESVVEASKGGLPFSPSVALKVQEFFRGSKEDEKYNLSSREMEILQLLSNGLKKKAIAGRLFISIETVATHIKNIYKKLHVHGAAAATAKAIREGLVK